MELIEREPYFSSLQSQLEKISEEGRCIFITGEAGIGKTSLIQSFCKRIKNESTIYTGMCDALFTPRPLAPLYDIAWQIGNNFAEEIKNITDRSLLFAKFFHVLANHHRPVIILFEDIHWADAATFDFIKFFTRRITQTHCLFICTYRDHEIYSNHPLKNVLGEMVPDTFTMIPLRPLSKKAVDQLCKEKGYNTEEVYSLTDGNPFYVNEILASYSKGVPDNIKNSILSVYNRLGEATKIIWELISVVPKGFETIYLKELEPSYEAAIDKSLESKILIQNEGLIFFKHELYRITIESSLSHFKRVSLNKRILDHFLKRFENNGQVERIVHHSKNANEYEIVKKYAPIAAQQASSVGAHIEACKLYFTAIEYYQEDKTFELADLYECYSYECYLTSKIKEAISSQEKALKIRKEKKNIEKTGNCLRFLSQLWWYAGNRKLAESFAMKAIKVLNDQPSSKAKAMAFSNMSHLKMQSEQTRECIYWGKKAVETAKEVGDEETISNTLNSMGTTLMLNPSSMSKGKAFLQQSLKIALKNSLQENVAHAYNNLGSNSVTIKEYGFAKKCLDQGIQYCEERDLDSLKLYMQAWKSRLYLETGKWEDAFNIAHDLLTKETLYPAAKITVLCVLSTIKIRKGEKDAIPLLLEAKAMAFEAKEPVRIVPVYMAFLEYEWLTGQAYIETEMLSEIIHRMVKLRKFRKGGSRFYFWLKKAGKESLFPENIIKEVPVHKRKKGFKEMGFWEQVGAPYEQALELFEGNEKDKRKAIGILQELGAEAVVEKLKKEMKDCGIKGIPRGMRKTTRANPAQLTSREMDILQLVKEGMQNKEIASQLFISPKTVDHHISSILFKLNVNSRGKAAQKAIDLEI